MMLLQPLCLSVCTSDVRTPQGFSVLHHKCSTIFSVDLKCENVTYEQCTHGFIPYVARKFKHVYMQ